MLDGRIDAHDDLWPRATGNWVEDDVLDLVDAEPIHDGRLGWVAPTLAILTGAGWIGGLLWSARDSLAELSPVDLAQFLASLCIAPALIGIIWLLARRTSRAEARRFGASAQAMRAEAASLEHRIASLSRVLATQREQLAIQLDAGTAAAARFETIGRAMAQEVEQAQAHADSLANTAERARATVGELLAAMPRARAESEEVGRRLDQAGLTAAAQAAALEAQLLALGRHARESDEQAAASAERLAIQITRMDAVGDQASARLEHAAVAAADTIDTLLGNVAGRLDEHVAHLDSTGALAGTRLTAVTGELAGAVDAMIGRTERAADDARLELIRQGEAMVTGVDAHRAQLDAAGRDSAEALAIRLDDIDAAIDRIAGRIAKQRAAGQELVGDLSEGLGLVERQLDTLHAQGTARTQTLSTSINALGGSADAMTEALRAGDEMATRTISNTEALLVALDAATREIDETLPEALTRLDTRIDASRRVLGQAKPELLALVTSAEGTHHAIEAIAGLITDQRLTLDKLSGTLLDTLSSSRTKANDLGEAIDEAIGSSHRLSEDAAPRLVEALLRVRETAQAAADRARETLSTVIPEAVLSLERASADAMNRATVDTVERHVASIGDATQAAVDATARATEQLTAQIDAIVDHSAALDARMERARIEREANDGDSIARRVAQLIDMLHSESIDIARAFAPDVSDSAWAAYLKGDRGVFTRRAVRLLDASDAARISRFYDTDPEFREQVNRYIHDFESMLRGILAQRDGSPLGVTLLSSDMGKLYVALAQGIDRLR